MGLWVLRERKRGKRDLGVVVAMEDSGKNKGDGGKRNGENLDLIVCGRIYGFICKILTCHFLIEVYTSFLLNLEKTFNKYRFNTLVLHTNNNMPPQLLPFDLHLKKKLTHTQ